MQRINQIATYLTVFGAFHCWEVCNSVRDACAWRIDIGTYAFLLTQLTLHAINYTVTNKHASDIHFTTFCWPTTPCWCAFVVKNLQATLHFSARHQFAIVKVTARNDSETQYATNTRTAYGNRIEKSLLARIRHPATKFMTTISSSY